ncbi:MAG: tetratricopeptide repeat protein [Saprospiraceae bacterium]|nr:tetratricopeptide repeat protein [Saprospiraceae bacterium]
MHSATPVWPVALLLALTAVVYLPMLQHQFTNWDDEAYVVNNALLRGPDWLGIFTEPVVSNYHPLTVLSLAFNYQISGLNPFSYLLFNGLLHLANTVLVYHFARLISGKHQWVGLFTATVFALHPMHVESVAWVSERKDLLYTLFYLLALIRYWSYLVDARREDYFWCLALFVLALLSKPAAIVLPLGLLLLDYWKQRSFRFAKVWLEKIPFLALSVFFGILTLLIQSEKALVSIEKFSLLDRFFFACYNLVAYAGYFFVPLKLSAFHPFPQPGALGWAAQAAPLAVLLVAGGIWYFRKNRALVFGALFYLANLVLVLQLITVGNTLLSERYTYVPYIGLAFALAVGIQEKISKRAWWVLPAALALAFGVLTRQRVHVWQNSETLWSDAISGYPGTPIPHSNRANYFYSQALLPANANQSKALMEKALADCNAALKTRPDHFASLDVRSIIYLQFGQYENALEDASKMVDLRPADKKGYLNRGSAYERLKRYDEALADYNRCLQIDPELADALNGRGTVLFNAKKQYREALADFERALSIKEDGGYYLNRSRCFFMLGEKSKALENARAAQRLGARVDAGYLKLLE